ncbi:hypothetical protein LEP3755_35660 [Leptolyngbya sp. NIES-3755]|nr:hypothetical protein LEP3755_35660 [Leptolyngbya sp. NIES-3755]
MAKAVFEKAPLTEVVCGVEFNAPNFSSVHFGMYWQKVLERFPMPPLDRSPIGEMPILSLMPQLRRVWFQSQDQKKLVQLQADRFLYNWRKLAENDRYPHFQEVYQEFEREWAVFQEWWDEIGKVQQIPLNVPGVEFSFRALQPLRYELTYINQIDASFGWTNSSDHRKIFNFLGRDWEGCRVGKPGLHNTNLEFVLPDGLGTLGVAISQAMKLEDETALLFCELTARSPDARVNLQEWFKAANKNIVQTFIDLLQEDIKREWDLKWLEP